MEFLKYLLEEARSDIVGGVVSGLVVASIGYLLKVLWVDVSFRRLGVIVGVAILAVASLYYLGISLTNDLIMVGGMVGACICVYYLWVRDESRIHLERRPPRHYKGPHKYQKWRRLAKSGIIAFLALTGTAFYLHYLEQQALEDKLIILVADFGERESDDYKVTDTILANLHQELRPYKDVYVWALKHTITQEEGSEKARYEGEKYHASIVIWGWYGHPGKNAPVSVNFELPIIFPGLCPAAVGAVRTMPNSISLQSDLSSEIIELTHFSVGMINFSGRNWKRAITHFSEALDSVSEQGPVGRFTSLDSSEKTYSLLMDPNYIYFFRGLAYSLQGDSDLAITDFDEIIGRNPKLDQSIAFSTNLVRVYINRAIALIEEDDLQAAIADLDKALILDPEADLAYMYRGIAHEKQGEMDIAIEDYGKAIKYSDGDKCAYIQRGNGFKLQGELDAALADYNKAVETDPNFALGYVNIGVVYRDEGDSDAAETAFKKALEADSESADAYNMLGFMNKERGDIENALSYYSKVIEIDPTYSGVYSTRAGLFEKLNEPQRAIDDYIRSMDYSTTNNYAASKIVNLCKDSNLCNYTEKVLDSTLTQSPHNGWFYYVRGKLFVQTGDYAKAENSFIAALELDSSQTSWLEALANVYEETGKTDQVLDTYIKLVQLEASNNYHRQKLAQFCKSNDLCRPTAIELTQLILGQPDTLPLLLARAQVYQTYDVKKALKDFDKAISLKPNESDVYELRAKAHEDGGNFDDALNDYFAAIKLDEKDFHTSYSIINVCQKINNCDEVIFHLNETIVRQGGVPSLIYTRARVHEARENYTAALDDYSYLLRLGSDIGLSNIYTHRAEVFENLGHIQLAIDDRTRLIEDYNSSESLYRRGLLYEKQGKIDLALTDFQDYLKKNPSSHRKKEIDDMIQELTQ